MSSDSGIVSALISQPGVRGMPRREVEQSFLPGFNGMRAADSEFVELPPESDRILADIPAVSGFVLKTAQQDADPFEHTIRDAHELEYVALLAARWRRVNTWRCGSLIQPSGRMIASNAQNLRQ